MYQYFGFPSFPREWVDSSLQNVFFERHDERLLKAIFFKTPLMFTLVHIVSTVLYNIQYTCTK